MPNMVLGKSAMYDPSTQAHKPRRASRPKISLPLTVIILLVLALQVVLLPRYISRPSSNAIKLSGFHRDRLEAKLKECAAYSSLPVKYPVTQAGSRANPRWNPKSGQKQNESVLLKNATLFDGETILSRPVDIFFEKGVVTSVVPSSEGHSFYSEASNDVQVFNLEGKYVTPGLVDMHSHHLALTWPQLRATGDENEVNPATGPITSQVRIIDSIKAYDVGTTIIASGGVTTSLILPGSANIMGGEAVLVKNVLNSGENGEPVVEEVLLEHGVPPELRRRFMKMACGENPMRVYKHTRMGNAWIFREHMERAKELKLQQDQWCLEAAAVREKGDADEISEFMRKSESHDGTPGATDYLEYDSSIAILRGKIGVNIHCYESEDFEDMISHSKEFGFRIQAFHHALDAWEVPELIKASGENITIATFAEFGLYKKEAFDTNLWAGKILAEHGVPVAYKSDHVTQETSAKYLLFQAATAHSFHLSEELALQSVTSVPARSLEIDHRVGYVRPGYDADLVVWDSHPLTVGATALQVYIDGKATLDTEKVVESSLGSKTVEKPLEKPKMRKMIKGDVRERVCREAEKEGSKITITGIKKSYLDGVSPRVADDKLLTMVVDGGSVVCFDVEGQCGNVEGPTINLDSGYVLPGLTAVTVSLGILEIPSEDTTSDGKISTKLDPEDVTYAKYGIHLDGRGFARARIGGVTRAVTAPISGGFSGGVSVGIRTSGKQTVLDGGIFQDDVALHFIIGQEGKDGALPSISSGISKLRQIISGSYGNGSVYERAANGSLPVVVHAENEYDITQVIRIKQDYPKADLVILGGTGAHLVAKELAQAQIPVILTAARGAPDTFEKRNGLPGPPLSRSPAAVLTEAGVKFGLAIGGESDSHIHNIPIEASWAAKYAGLSDPQAVDLVSRNIEEILSLDVGKRDIVIWEGDPLQFGASVVLAFSGEGAVEMCWPEAK